jgi:hypothetical protein
MPITQQLADNALRESIRVPLEQLGLRPIDSIATSSASRPNLPRRGLLQPPANTIDLLSLTRDPNGVLRWEAGLGLVTTISPLRRAGRAALPLGQIVQQFAYEQIAPNEVVATLEKLDRWLTPNMDVGLRRVLNDKGDLGPFNGPDAAGKRVLLFIHGTFSNCDNTMEELRQADDGIGRKLLARALRQYDFVLTFDHPTVGVSPMLNAFDLAAMLRPAPKEIDIICHSRGGLVTRWYLEGFATDELRRHARAVMVGSTIGGTSLAAPARLRAAMDYLANVGEMLGTVAKIGSAHPFIAAAGVLMKVMTSVTRLAAKTPIFDGAIAIIPGLHGQSRVGNSPELLRLYRNTGASFGQSGLTYYAVKANFEPNDPGWNFLQYFSKPMQRLANWGADIVFDGPNDLVADCTSMTHLADKVEITDFHDFGTTAAVHHTNYFRQKETVQFFLDSFRID